MFWALPQKCLLRGLLNNKRCQEKQAEFAYLFGKLPSTRVFLSAEKPHQGMQKRKANFAVCRDTITLTLKKTLTKDVFKVLKRANNDIDLIAVMIHFFIVLLFFLTQTVSCLYELIMISFKN